MQIPKNSPGHLVYKPIKRIIMDNINNMIIQNLCLTAKFFKKSQNKNLENS